MASLKKVSTHCKNCGIEWNEDMSNKFPRRALCYPCKKKWQDSVNEIEKERRKNNGVVRLATKKTPYTFRYRKDFWLELRTKLKTMKTREEWLPFIQKRMDEIIEDTQLMDYLNDTQIAKYD